MINTSAFRGFFIGSRRKMLSLSLLTVLAATASAASNPSVGIQSTAARSNVAVIDPNGLELDGAGAAERVVTLETTDVTLLVVWALLTLGMVALVISDRRGPAKRVAPPRGLAPHAMN